MKKWMILTLLSVVSACAGGPATDGCEWVRAIRPTSTDVDAMSDALAGQILAHNEAGSRVCGWAP
ncbi:hypothetical protein SAMN05216258_11061 [Albimonas pacifica]|uniref:Uncharacterized protein n=1 Tax=Albimonas pacifica TaxID=1114924 RepID=A0A1I3LJH6_9RHOB|nr:hypothetical protein SAMN05216258_11061 [Albimonas pacifica]